MGLWRRSTYWKKQLQQVQTNELTCWAASHKANFVNKLLSLEPPGEGSTNRGLRQEDEGFYANTSSDGDLLVSELMYRIQDEKLKNPESPFATEFQVILSHFDDQ